MILLLTLSSVKQVQGYPIVAAASCFKNYSMAKVQLGEGRLLCRLENSKL